MALPIGDWQFWVCTLVGLGAVGWLLRTVLPGLRLTRRRSKRKVSLTVEGRPPR